MTFRRVIMEILVPNDEFPTDGKVQEAVENGLMVAAFSVRRDVLVIRKGYLVDFTEEQWKKVEETKEAP